MTCCVASLCDDRHGIVLAADKMVGLGMIESESNIQKVLRVHGNWWVMLAGNKISPAFDILDEVKQKLSRHRVVSVQQASQVLSDAYKSRRAAEAEANYLAPIGWTLRQFNSRASVGLIPDAMRVTISQMVENHHLSISLIGAGFDGRGRGHIFSVDDGEERGNAQRHDIPGYYSIGSGGYGATYMMAYRKVSPAMPIREVLYYVAEGKYFGELAGGVGTRTDLYVLRHDKPYLKVKESAIDDKLMKLCERLEPRRLGKNAIRILNSFRGKRMNTIPKLKLQRDGGDTVITT